MSLYAQTSGDPGKDGQKKIVDAFTGRRLPPEEEEYVLLVISAAKAEPKEQRAFSAFRSQSPIVR